MKIIPVTSSGYQKLIRQLHKLKTIDRPLAVNEVEKTRQELKHCDKKGYENFLDNIQYYEARHNQGIVETKILDIENKISMSEIIDIKNDKKFTVVFSSTVVIKDNNTDKISKYKIVGVDESDIHKGLLSLESPLAKALIGHTKGDTIMVRMPSGTKEFHIIDVIYNE